MDLKRTWERIGSEVKAYTSMKKQYYPKSEVLTGTGQARKHINQFEYFENIKHFLHINHIKPNAPLKSQISFIKRTQRRKPTKAHKMHFRKFNGKEMCALKLNVVNRVMEGINIHK